MSISLDVLTDMTQYDIYTTGSSSAILNDSPETHKTNPAYVEKIISM